MPPDPDCESKGIPLHLHRCARSPDQDFKGDELLYRRTPNTHGDLTAAIKFNRMSVNREKYCEEPSDTLWNEKEGGTHDGFGVISLPVGALSRSWPHKALKNVSFSLRPEHTPDPCNYPHTEVVANREEADGSLTPLANIKPPSTKLAIREDLARFLKVEIPSPKTD